MNYEDIATQRLASQFANSPKLQALMAAIVGPLTTLEESSNSVANDRWIDSAVGVQLDGCGLIVGEPRLGKDDDSYRAAIRFRVAINVSKATPFDMIRGLKFLTEPSDSQYLEAFPATVLLFTDGIFTTKEIQAAMQDLAPCAISVVPVAVSYAYKPFRFGSSPTPGELFVNGSADYLTADGSDLLAGESGIPASAATFGGVVAAEIDVGLGYLDIGGSTLAVYNPNSLVTIGHDNLTGVFQ